MRMLISAEHVALNAELHARVPAYGTGGHKWADAIRELVESTGAKSVCDYGAGKGSLREALRPITVHEYDPCVVGKEVPPSSAGIVACTDVLEHVEPECIDAVLTHIRSLATRAILLGISCRVGGKRLADGRPAHILVRSHEWWAAKLAEHGQYQRIEGDVHDYNALWIL